MQLKLSNIRIPVGSKDGLKATVCRQFGIRMEDMQDFRVVRQAIDARKRNNVVFDYQVMVTLPEQYQRLVDQAGVSVWQPPVEVVYPRWRGTHRPVVVGFGPSGMFAALYLARCQARPIILERGERIEERKLSVAAFLNHRTLNIRSNVQFGEGGAGTFSDGKLNTNVHSEYNTFILNEFYKHGANEDVTYMQNPHVGTDYLEKVVRNIRLEIESLGGEFHFNTTFVDFRQEGSLLHLQCDPDIALVTEHLLLGLGHSARDTIRQLHAHGLLMEPKPFSMGVRIEHLQRNINRMQYGAAARLLPPASYKGVVHLKERSVYTFCMCPGGTVMASASEPNSIVTNGMSERSRDKANANSALLVNVTPEDYFHNSPLDGLAYQEKYERMAFEVAGDYRAPGNLVGEFLQNRIARQHRSVTPSYPHGIVYCDFNRCMPDYVVESLRESIPLMDRKMRGFADPDAVMTGVETRSSSPVRILRGNDRQCVVKGIYPMGEGAGYAGGIMSAAIDGLKTAMATMNNPF
ncbi:MAG: FAD-binding protein [Bacteroidales bacterium]|nr:FAD-binding protein [Bacteroidales bacterium]